MNYADELLEKLIKYNDIETATAVWGEANSIASQMADVKRTARAVVERHLRETGEMKGKTSTCTYGWTNPKPKLVLNKTEWNKAITANKELYDIVSSFEWNKVKLEEAQKDFLEEVYPDPRIYIK